MLSVELIADPHFFQVCQGKQDQKETKVQKDQEVQEVGNGWKRIKLFQDRSINLQVLRERKESWEIAESKELQVGFISQTFSFFLLYVSAASTRQAKLASLVIMAEKGSQVRRVAMDRKEAVDILLVDMCAMLFCLQKH